MNREKWECPHCSRTEGGEPPHKEIVFGTEYEDKPEVTADVTCETVYLTRNDGYGIALEHREFIELIELFTMAQENMDSSNRIEGLEVDEDDVWRTLAMKKMYQSPDNE